MLARFFGRCVEKPGLAYHRAVLARKRAYNHYSSGIAELLYLGLCVGLVKHARPIHTPGKVMGSVTLKPVWE